MSLALPALPRTTRIEIVKKLSGNVRYGNDCNVMILNIYGCAVRPCNGINPGKSAQPRSARRFGILSVRNIVVPNLSELGCEERG
jgi:hypothetical protein